MWGLVILAAGAEAVLYLTNGFGGRWRLVARSAGIAVAVIAVGALDLRSWNKEYRTEDLRVSLAAPHPNQLGTGELDLNFLIVNKAQGSLLEEVLAIEIATTDTSKDASTRNAALCKLEVSNLMGKGLREGLVHPSQKALHISAPRPSKGLPPPAYGSYANLPFQDDNKLDVVYYDPKTISVAGKNFANLSIGLETGQPLALAVHFETDPASWSVHNVLVLCGAIRYVSTIGQDTWAVCPVQAISQIWDADGKGFGVSGGPTTANQYVFGTNSNDSRCGVWP